MAFSLISKELRKEWLMNTKKSHELFNEAKRFIPGGVNSPVRAFKSVGREPIFVDHGKGSKIYDADGNEYIDFVSSWGPMILGHGHPRVISALSETIKGGTSFGAPTSLEVMLAKMVTEAFPSIETVRLVSSGTEAAMSAIRLARGYTGRDKLIKFEGCYHGHSDGLLVKTGSGAATLGIPGSAGVPADYVKNTLSVPYNNLAATEKVVEKYSQEIAAIIVEPIAGNMGVVPPVQGFLEGLRKIATRFEIVLIFDEVITGFRVSYGGAQELYHTKPDLTCLGKIIGGGLPVGAFGGKREIMNRLAPEGDVYQAGTLSGNPLAVRGGIETLKILRQDDVYQKLEKRSRNFCKEIEGIFRESGVPVRINRVGSMFTIFFTDSEVLDYFTAKHCDTESYAQYFREMLNGGIYLAPSQFEASFLSLAHSDEDLEKAIKAIGGAVKSFKA